MTYLFREIEFPKAEGKATSCVIRVTNEPSVTIKTWNNADPHGTIAKSEYEVSTALTVLDRMANDLQREVEIRRLASVSQCT